MSDDADPTPYFSKTYAEAREKFLAGVGKQGFNHWSVEHPNKAGMAGETLAMDFATHGPKDAEAGLVLVCATHGVEGFCGSGAQVGLLQTGLLGEIAKTVRVILVHGHNPYGFSWVRRVNEDNVDLNRNYVDHDKPYPENAAYAELHTAIAPPALDDETMTRVNAVLRSYAASHGAFGLQEAVSRGQYRYPDGLYFGGNFPTWSNRTLGAGLRKAAAGLKRVGVIDFHTGLGPFGHGEIISEYETGSPADRRLAAWFEGEAKSTRAGDSVSADLTGTLDHALETILAPATVTACAIEFGTVRTEEVFYALRADNWLHLYGKVDTPQGKAIKDAIRKAFYPDTDDWKDLVWRRSIWAVKRMSQGLSA